MNLDETAIYRCAMKARGYISKSRCEHTGRVPARFVNKSLQRGTATHVSIITHRTDLQGVLPQFVLLNQRTFKVSDLPEGNTSGLQFWRGETAWNTAAKMVRILEAIACKLADKTGTLQPVILLDMAPCHIDHQVIAAANRLGLWLLYVPARLTYLLQPLDVAAFCRFKQHLNSLFLARQDTTGTLKTSDWIRTLCTLGKTFWRGTPWKSTFQAVGLFGKQTDLIEEIRCMGLLRKKDGPTAMPTEEELQTIWPRKKNVPFGSLLWLPAKLAIDDID